MASTMSVTGVVGGENILKLVRGGSSTISAFGFGGQRQRNNPTGAAPTKDDGVQHCFSVDAWRERPHKRGLIECEAMNLKMTTMMPYETRNLPPTSYASSSSCGVGMVSLPCSLGPRCLIGCSDSHPSIPIHL